MNTVPDTFLSLFAGYAVIWGLLAIYIIYLGKRVGRLERRGGSASSKTKE